MFRSFLFLVSLSTLPFLSNCATDRSYTSTDREKTRSSVILRTALHAVDRLDSAAIGLNGSLVGGDRRGVERELRRARLAWKGAEWIAEHVAPAASRGINGPPLPEVEEDDQNRSIHPPEGLQTIEAMFFEGTGHDTLRVEVRLMRSNIRRLRSVLSSTNLADEQVIEAMRRELVRVAAFGLSGFDAPALKSATQESRVALATVGVYLRLYLTDLPGEDSLGGRIATLLAGGDAALAGAGFEMFDRLDFLRDVLDPLFGTVAEMRERLGIGGPEVRSALDPSARSLFARASWRPDAFAPLDADTLGGAARVDLGRLLFFDPLLSGSGARSCGSCHQPSRAFTDGEPRSLAVEGEGRATRNAPTLINAALQSALFADRRVSYLEDQVVAVVGNAVEMHGSLEAAARTLSTSSGYQRLFRVAFPAQGPDTGISGRTIRRAIAAYIRSLIAFDSPFDRYVRGAAATYPPEARAGFNLFMGSAACGTCHFVPLFSGAVPPRYTESEGEILGTTGRFDTLHPRLDTDPGAMPVHNIEIDRGKFKTPTVRNAALTAPYMHNGGFRTLEEVMAFYNHGGGAGLGLDVPYQTLSADPLDLSVQEISSIIAFINTLSDTAGTTAVPALLPALADGRARTPVVGYGLSR